MPRGRGVIAGLAMKQTAISLSTVTSSMLATGTFQATISQVVRQQPICLKACVNGKSFVLCLTFMPWQHALGATIAVQRSANTPRHLTQLLLR